jgi:hypothetical protein
MTETNLSSENWCLFKEKLNKKPSTNVYFILSFIKFIVFGIFSRVYFAQKLINIDCRIIFTLYFLVAESVYRYQLKGSTSHNFLLEITVIRFSETVPTHIIPSEMR